MVEPIKIASLADGPDVSEDGDTIHAALVLEDSTQLPIQMHRAGLAALAFRLARASEMAADRARKRGATDVYEGVDVLRMHAQAAMGLPEIWVTAHTHRFPQPFRLSIAQAEDLALSLSRAIDGAKRSLGKPSH